MTMNDCIKCDILTNEIKILINSLYKLHKIMKKDCWVCCQCASKGKNELANRIESIDSDERTKDYIRAALKERHFEKCKIEVRENIPINEIGPLNGDLMGIDLSKTFVRDFNWFHDLIKTQYSDIYNKIIVNEQCFKENENMLFEFPIILVTPPCRGIKRKSYDVKLKYYVEDGNHRLLKWIDSGNETVPAFVIIDPEYAP